MQSCSRYHPSQSQFYSLRRFLRLNVKKEADALICEKGTVRYEEREFDTTETNAGLPTLLDLDTKRRKRRFYRTRALGKRSC